MRTVKLVNTKRLLNIKRAAAIILVGIMIVTMLVPVRSFAEDTESKTVRVGYVNAKMYEEGGEGEYKTGSGYEYLQKISYLTGWKYEYVYGTFKECYDMLVNGEIDLFGNLSYTPSRDGLFNYSMFPQGNEVYYIYTNEANRELASGDPSRMNGCKVGATSDSYQRELLSNWFTMNNVTAEVVTYTGYAALMEALENGEVNAIVTPDLSVEYECIPVVEIGYSEYYFGVSKQRPDLLEDLNAAMHEIQSDEFDYNGQLARKYHSRTVSSTELTDEELQWLEEHDNTLHVGLLDNNLPYSTQDADGTVSGIIKTLDDNMEKSLGIKVEETCYRDTDALTDALKRNEIDIMGPVYGDMYIAEQYDHVLTNEMITVTPVMLYNHSDFDENSAVIAVSKETLVSEDVVHVLFPNATVMNYDSMEACLQAVVAGKADCTMISSVRLNLLREYPEMQKLQFADLPMQSEICLATTKDKRLAASIMNRGIALSSSALNGGVLAENSFVTQRVTVRDFVRENMLLVMSLAGVIILVLAYMAFSLYRSRKQVQAALMEAKEASVAKTAFLSNMSHDIRTPMNAITGITVLMEHESGMTDRQYTYIEKLKQSSQHLLSLINDVLDMSKIESSKITINNEPVCLADQVSQIDSIIRPQTNERGHTFTVSTHNMIHEFVITDGVRLRQILINLLSNATKYTPGGGNISLDFTELPCDVPGHASYRITVEDNGCGMTQEFMKRIFEPFTRAENTMTNKVQGTGLGMAITKKIIDLMGGEIKIESAIDKGSRFDVYLTFSINENADTYPGADSVLLVSENDEFINNMNILMDASNVKFVTAAACSHAAELLKENDFDAVLLGGMLHDKALADNVELLRSSARRDIFIFCVDHAEPENEEEVLKTSGINGIIPRPFFMSDLAKAIDRAAKKQLRQNKHTSALKGLRFMCAEDNALNAEILHALLEMEGASCVIYPNGKEIVDAFADVKPGDYDAILMDIQMPVMNGLDASMAIRSGANPYGKEIPIFAMTANAFTEDMQKAKAAGMNEHLAKPLDMRRLLAVVGQYCHTDGQNN